MIFKSPPSSILSSIRIKNVLFLLILSQLFFCSPKGPQTYDSPLIGKTKEQLIQIKGVAKTIRVYEDSEVYIYKKREEYFGKSTQPKEGIALVPKKVFEIEQIYYINSQKIVYKYQVWRKRID
jgi:hypothetical protein